MSAGAKSGKYVDYAVEGSTAHVTLNSPHNRNALSSALVEQLHQGMRDAAGDPKVRAVVLGHTGGTFCAGADLSEASGPSGGDATTDRTRQLTELLRAILELPVPVVGAID
ncbi:MAG TPA: enoyl-CoA hydratase-related protein, partial [Mycobacterium sp.]|nr:enoyl-CoA hydratase-related protein [Mycobacterium sp.]